MKELTAIERFFSSSDGCENLIAHEKINRIARDVEKIMYVVRSEIEVSLEEKKKQHGEKLTHIHTDT